MDMDFTFATLFWLFVPMPLLILLSLLSLFKQIHHEKKKEVIVTDLVKKPVFPEKNINEGGY